MTTFIRSMLGALALSLTLPAFAADLAGADKEFMEKAAQSGQLEVLASKMAQTRASNAQVKTFAERMVKDHGETDTKLRALAASKNVKLPNEPAGKHKDQLRALESLEGARFDAAYASQVGVAAHQEAVTLFEVASREARDADVKAFAAATLPALKHHLEMARTLSNAVTGPGQSPSGPGASRPAVR